MNDTQLLQLARQIDSLREDANDLADLVADEVWDRFENEIDQLVGDSFIFDIASNTRLSLASSLSGCFSDVLERHVLRRIEALSAALDAAVPGSKDSGSVEIMGVRKSLKLWRQADPMIGEAIERAKPGLIGMLFLASDPTSEAWDREMEENANRVRKNLYALRDKIIDMVREDTLRVIQLAIVAHRARLDAAAHNTPGG